MIVQHFFRGYSDVNGTINKASIQYSKYMASLTNCVIHLHAQNIRFVCLFKYIYIPTKVTLEILQKKSNFDQMNLMVLLIYSVTINK